MQAGGAPRAGVQSGVQRVGGSPARAARQTASHDAAVAAQRAVREALAAVVRGLVLLHVVDLLRSQKEATGGRAAADVGAQVAVTTPGGCTTARAQAARVGWAEAGHAAHAARGLVGHAVALLHAMCPVHPWQWRTRPCVSAHVSPRLGCGCITAAPSAAGASLSLLIFRALLVGCSCPRGGRPLPAAPLPGAADAASAGCAGAAAAAGAALGPAAGTLSKGEGGGRCEDSMRVMGGRSRLPEPAEPAGAASGTASTAAMLCPAPPAALRADATRSPARGGSMRAHCERLRTAGLLRGRDGGSSGGGRRRQWGRSEGGGSLRTAQRR